MPRTAAWYPRACEFAAKKGRSHFGLPQSVIGFFPAGINKTVFWGLSLINPNHPVELQTTGWRTSAPSEWTTLLFSVDSGEAPGMKKILAGAAFLLGGIN